MLREFEKLERQLLGARKTEESAASRERREKLHSFILHLSETIQQIEKGYELDDPTMTYIAAMGTFAPLFDHARFLNIAQKMNLPMPKG